MPFGLLAMFASVGLAAGPQTVRIEVESRDAPEGTRLLARTTWLGEDRATELTDDGTAPGDRLGDGVYTAVWTGDEVRILPVSVVAVNAAGVATTLTTADEAIVAGEDRLAYTITWGDTPAVRRVAAAASARAMEVADSASVAAALGWTGLVLAYVAWLAGRLPLPGRGR